MLGFCYFTATVVTSHHKKYAMMFYIGYVTMGFGLLFGAIVCLLFALAIHHLKRTNAQCSNQG